MIVWMVILGLAAALGVVIFISEQQNRATFTQILTEGWIYFISAIGGDEDEPPALVKIGYSHRDPKLYRLPEIETMSPQKLEVLYSFHTSQPELVEHAIHTELASSRHHGEWFDRNAALAYIAHHKGEF